MEEDKLKKYTISTVFPNEEILNDALNKRNVIEEDIKILKGKLEILNNTKVLKTDRLVRELKAIENVLSEFQGLREFSTETVRRNAELQVELETYKKIAEKLANRLATKSNDCFFCENYNGSKCEIYENRTQCIIDWAKKEVEKV